MSLGIQLMQEHLTGRGALGRGSWDHLMGLGWDPQQITAIGPATGWQVGEAVGEMMGQYPNAPRNIGLSGLYNLGAAQKWVGKGDSPETIAAAGLRLADTPRGRATGLSGWQAGFTPEAGTWLMDHYTDQAAKEKAQADKEKMWEERIANIPTATELMEAMPSPKIRAGKDYATTGRSAQGMRIKRGTKFAEGGKRGTKGYFGAGAKFRGDTTPAMNIAGKGGAVSQAQNTLNTA